jgi:hypothetical protein
LTSLDHFATLKPPENLLRHALFPPSIQAEETKREEEEKAAAAAAAAAAKEKGGKKPKAETAKPVDTDPHGEKLAQVREGLY